MELFRVGVPPLWNSRPQTLNNGLLLGGFVTVSIQNRMDSPYLDGIKNTESLPPAYGLRGCMVFREKMHFQFPKGLKLIEFGKPCPVGGVESVFKSRYLLGRWFACFGFCLGAFVIHAIPII